MILLSDVDGFYSANPQNDPAAHRFETIDEITPEIESMAGEGVSGLSKGGMITKILAAKTATAGGCAMAITEGSVSRPLTALEHGANATWFKAQVTPQQARKRWISSMKPQGSVHVDAGATAALARGKSLLPAGVTLVEGAFERGDPVALISENGHNLGQGLSAYSAQEARAIKGCQSFEVESILGYSGRVALIHRDDMAL